MSNTVQAIISAFDDPIKEIEIIRNGITPQVIEKFLRPQNYVMQDILTRLHIAISTYKSKKSKQEALDSAASEKLMRLFSVIRNANDVLGKNQTKEWLYREVTSLGNQRPIDLLDTEVGHRLVEQSLQQIKFGIYN